MTTIDLYDQLTRGINATELASEGQSRMSEAASRADQFQNTLLKAKNLLLEVKDNNQDILRLKDRLMAATKSDKEAEICSRIKKICDDSYDKLTALRQLIKTAGDMVEHLKGEEPDEPETYSKMMRKQHLSQQINKVLDETFGIQKMVEKYSVETNLKRIRLILPEASEEEVKKLASAPSGLQQAVEKKVTGKVSKKWVYTYNDIMDKSEGIKALQSSVQDNLRLMKEVAMLVQEQGEQIDSILANVGEAKDYVVKAEKVLVKEKEEHKKSRKKLCCIIFLSLAVLALILTPIIIKVVQSKNASSSAWDCPLTRELTLIDTVFTGLIQYDEARMIKEKGTCLTPLNW